MAAQCVYVCISNYCVFSVYNSMCDGYMEEAVFGLRLKCRTGVSFQEKRPDTGTFPPLGKHMTYI